MSILNVAFYHSDWLAGTRGLCAEETGVYIALKAPICETTGAIERDLVTWQPIGALVADDLARIEALRGGRK